MLDAMTPRGTRGAYRKEDRVQLPLELQKELVEKAAAKFGNCQELAKRLNIPKSSVHYYRIGRLTVPVSVLEQMLEIANDDSLRDRIKSRGVTKDRSWATEHAQDVFREMCRDKLRLPPRDNLEKDSELRRKAAAIVSYVLAEGSVWLQKEKFGEHAVNITFADYETDLYEHFRSLCKDVFWYEIGPPQKPGNNAKAIRGFIYSRFIAQWLIENGIPPGEKASSEPRLPRWVMDASDKETWIAALQPILDGEGSVSYSFDGGFNGFSVSQSRHTDLDVYLLPKRAGSGKDVRTLAIGDLRDKCVFGIPVLSYCAMVARSRILDDVVLLLSRLGFRPRPFIVSMYLKNDGNWSCNWRISIPRHETQKLLKHRLVTQELKLYGLQLHVLPVQ